MKEIIVEHIEGGRIESATLTLSFKTMKYLHSILAPLSDNDMEKLNDGHVIYNGMNPGYLFYDTLNKILNDE